LPLARCSRRNGPLEVWPGGSHLWSPEVLGRHRVSDEIQDGSNPALEDLARRIPSQRLLLEPGSLLIRDPGMLHRGTPNLTRKPRTMLSICYLRRDYDYDYGSAEYNLDPELFQGLDSSVQRLFPEMETRHQPRPVSRKRTAPSTQPLA
jgi:ectoine hydroxylase-related dioxygenase (phytanoyl-CoA dioxygenase family)